MKQLVQNLKTGKLDLLEVPVPALRPGGVLVRNVNSVVSLGTEKSTAEFAMKSLLGKARARPDLANKVIQLAKTGGLLEAYRQVMNRLDKETPLGYSSAGVVIGVGEGVEEFKVGDRVACSRGGFASHAEVIFVPANLCARIPEGVGFESGAFATVGAIALHSVRLCELEPGENLAVIGLGLLGQLAVQIARASGYRVFGMDINPRKVALAGDLGADDGATIGTDDDLGRAARFTGGHGFDAVLIFASTPSNAPIETAAEICREKGKVVVPGLVGLNVPRETFYQKELSLVVPRAWGAGFGDSEYELLGIDYPYPYVRWSARRNMEHVLELMASGKLRIEPLITARFRIADALTAYPAITAGKSGDPIGILVDYDVEPSLAVRIQLKPVQPKPRDTIGVGLIGVGTFATTTLLPNIRKMSGIHLRGIASATGPSGKHTGDKFGFEYCTTDYREILRDSEIDAVLIATRPNLHAEMVIEALRHGKDVLVEKPLCLSLPELKEILSVWKENPRRLLVGYNRRFSTFAIRARETFQGIGEPLVVRYLVNTAPFAREAYLVNPNEGGGIVRGDWGLLIDLAQFLAGSLPEIVYAAVPPNRGNYSRNENLSVTLTLRNGSVALLTWTACGGVSFNRERLEIFGGGIECTIENFRSMMIERRKSRTKKVWKLNRDIGHRNEFAAFFTAIRKGEPGPVSMEEALHTALATFAIEESLRTGAPVRIDPKDLAI